MNMKRLLFIIFFAIIIATVWIFFFARKIDNDEDDQSSSLIISKNAIYAEDQTPGHEVFISVAYFENPGFVAIHEDLSHAPGALLGVSRILPAGEIKNLSPISLSRKTRDGETIYAMLHIDDGDGFFNAAKDKPALDAIGDEAVMMAIMVHKDAPEPGIVNP